MLTARTTPAFLAAAFIAVLLSPSQASAYESLVGALRFAQFNVIWGEKGFGKTTILEKVLETKFPGAPVVSTTEFLAAMKDQDQMALEETYADLLRRAMFF